MDETPFDVENLDGQWPDDLARLAEEYDVRGTYVSIALACYCRLKAHAMHERAAGDVNRARVLEQDCDAIYAQLPSWAKW